MIKSKNRKLRNINFHKTTVHIKKNKFKKKKMTKHGDSQVSVNPYPSMIGIPISSKNCKTGMLTPAPPLGIYFIVGQI